MKIENNRVYLCKTIELAEQFLKECEKQGFLWIEGDKPTQYNIWKHISANIGFRTNNMRLSYNRIQYYKDNSNRFPPIVEYKPEQKQQTIVIKTDGNTVTAYMGDKRGVAKCNPADAFDLYTGAKLALDRLFGNDNGVREVDRKAKVGEYIKIVNAQMTFGDYHNGDVFKVQTTDGGGVDVEPYGKEVCTRIFHSEYVVLENYKPKK